MAGRPGGLGPPPSAGPAACSSHLRAGGASGLSGDTLGADPAGTQEGTADSLGAWALLTVGPWAALRASSVERPPPRQEPGPERVRARVAPVISRGSSEGPGGYLELLGLPGWKSHPRGNSPDTGVGPAPGGQVGQVSESRGLWDQQWARTCASAKSPGGTSRGTGRPRRPMSRAGPARVPSAGVLSDMAAVSTEGSGRGVGSNTKGEPVAEEQE